MDATERLPPLMKKSFEEIKSLPENEVTETIKQEGQTFQVTTWCEQLRPDQYRVMVSIHRKHVLGGSSLVAADGFTINSSGEIERLDQQQVQNLFL